MADLELALNLKADNGGLRGVVRQSKGDLDDLTQTNDRVDKSGRRAGKGLDEGGRGASIFRRHAQEANRTGHSFEKVLGNIGKVAAVAAGLLGGITLGALISDMTQTIFAAEQMQGALLSAVGGIPALADKAFSAIEQFASRTPYSLDQSVQGFIKLQNLGIRPTEERMAGFGNVAAAMGKDLNQMIEAVADASTGEFERLKEFGIKASQEGDRVKFTFQGVTTEVGKNSEEIVSYLTAIGNNQFGDAMANQMVRLPGLWSNLKDNIDGIWRDLGDAGVKDMFSSWISAGIEWTASIRAELKAGWFDWVGAELDVQLARFRGWWDLLEAAGKSYIDQTVKNWQWAFSVLGTDANGALESLGNVVGFVGDAIAELPVNIQTFAAIAIAEIGKVSADIDEFVELIGNNGRLVWENLTYSIESTLLLLQQKAGEVIESIIHKFGEMVTELGVSLAAINNTGVGDALISDAVLANVQQAGSAMQEYSAITQQVTADTAAANAEHQATVAALAAERAGIEAGAQARRDAAGQFIDDALAQRDATLAHQAALVQEAEAAAAAAKASYERNRAADAEKVSIDDVTQASQEAATATAKETEALDKLLDRLDPARVAARQYEESMKELTDRLADGTLSQTQFNAAVALLDKEAAKKIDQQTVALDKLLDKLYPTRAATRDYNESITLLKTGLAEGRITQEEFNASVEQLELAARKAVGGVISEAEALETAWKRGIERIDDTAEGWLKNFFLTGKATFAGIKDLFLEMLAEMIYAAARNQIILGVTTGGATLTSAGASAATSSLGSTGGISSFFGSGAGSSLGGVTSAIQGGFNSLANFYEGSANFFQAQGWHSAAGGARTAAGQYTGSLGSSTVNLGLNVGAGIVGSYAGRAVFQNDNSTGIGATAGGIVGSYWGPVGTAIGSFIGEGLEKVVGKAFGYKSGGDNRGFATFDLATGESSVRGSGKNITQANLDAALALADSLQSFAQAIGGSTFAGGVNFGSKSGIQFQGREHKSTESFLQDAFREVIRGATELDDEVKALLVARQGDAESLARDAVDALSLQKVFEAGQTYFAGISDFGHTFDVLTQAFRREGEALGDTFLRLETGLVLLSAAGLDAQRTVDNFRLAQQLIDRVGLATANNLVYTIRVMGDGLLKQFQTLQQEASRTNTVMYIQQVAQNRKLIESYDGTEASSVALAQATVARRDAELYLLAELTSVSKGITNRIADFREQLVLDGLDVEGQYNRYRDQISFVTALLANARSAAQVDFLENRAEELTRSAYGLLDESQQSAARPEFLSWLDTLEEVANDRLEEMKIGVVKASEDLDARSQNAIWEKAGLAGERLEHAAGELEAAGAVQQDAAQAINGAAGRLSNATGSLELAARNLRELLTIAPMGSLA